MATQEFESRRGMLEADVKRITDMFVSDNLPVEFEGHLTPYKTAKLIMQIDGLDAMPSSGSVTECFKRWQELGFANFNKKPFAFKDYSAKGYEVGLAALKEKHTAKLRKAREAAKKTTAK